MREAIQSILEAEAQAKQSLNEAEAQVRSSLARAREEARLTSGQAAQAVRLEAESLLRSSQEQAEEQRSNRLAGERDRIREEICIAEEARRHAVDECVRVILGLT
jgi:vacuolar-type H+-ATPase subunit H